jgi:hypothetical protein
VSRVRQARRLAERVEVWRTAILDLTQNPRPEQRFELMDDGSLVAWEQKSPGVGPPVRHVLKIHRTEPNVYGSGFNCWTLV